MEWAEFHDLAKDALANLYDFAYLRGHPLVDELAPDETMATPARVSLLRDSITEAIELLAPAERVPRSAKEWRPYLALRHAYIEYLTPEEVRARLGLGERQVMRERLRGIETVARILWERSRAASVAPIRHEPPQGDVTSVDHELVDLGLERELLSPADLLTYAVSSVQPLAEQHGVAIQVTLEHEEPLQVDRTLLRQALIAALGMAIHRAAASLVDLALRVDEQTLLVAVTWDDGQSAELGSTWMTLQSLVSAQMGSTSLSRAKERATIEIRVPVGPPATILAVDDNESSLHLLERLLTTAGYHVRTATDGQEGLDVAMATRPSLVLLDVMMRGMDGWEVLLKLKAMPETRHIPVVVCSVLPERDLALSLGASGFAQKPLRRLELMATIRTCLTAKHSSA